MYHSTLGSRVIKKKRRAPELAGWCSQMQTQRCPNPGRVMAPDNTHPSPGARCTLAAACGGAAARASPAGLPAGPVHGHGLGGCKRPGLPPSNTRVSCDSLLTGAVFVFHGTAGKIAIFHMCQPRLLDWCLPHSLLIRSVADGGWYRGGGGGFRGVAGDGGRAAVRGRQAGG